MINLNDIQFIIAGFFNNDLTLAGMAMFAVVMALIFALTKNVFQSLVIGLVITGIFSYMSILSNDIMILLIIVIVLGLAMTARNAVSGKSR